MILPLDREEVELPFKESTSNSSAPAGSWCYLTRFRAQSLRHHIKHTQTTSAANSKTCRKIKLLNAKDMPLRQMNGENYESAVTR